MYYCLKLLLVLSGAPAFEGRMFVLTRTVSMPRYSVLDPSLIITQNVLDEFSRLFRNLYNRYESDHRRGFIHTIHITEHKTVRKGRILI